MTRPSLTKIALATALLTGMSLAGAVAQETSQTTSQTPPWNQADAIHGEETMAKARKDVLAGSGDQKTLFIMLNQFETQSSGNEDNFYWNGQASWGGDINRVWLKSEGKASLDGGGVEDAEIQALYSRAITPFWNLQGGLRYDIEPDGLTHAVIALNGLAPYWLEVDASAFLSEKGDLTSRIEAEYELLLTQRLVLQPRMEAELSAQDIPERETGSGLNRIDAGIRLRYEIKPELAPYIGIEWQSAFGGTKDYIDAAGGKTDETLFLLGLRSWY